MSHFCNAVIQLRAEWLASQQHVIKRDRTKVTWMIFASTAMKLFLNTCKYSLEVYVLNGLIGHRSLAIIFNRFCLWNIDSGLAKVSI